MPTTEEQRIVSAADLSALQPGDAVLVTRDGRTLAVHVVRIAPPGTWGTSVLAGPRVTVGFGPGRWNIEVDAHILAAGHVRLERG